MKADASTETAVMATLNKFDEAYARRDIDGVLSLLAPDTDAVFIGTGADERRVGLAEMKTQLERDFAQSEAVSWEWGWHSVSAAGSVAWVAADLVVHVKTNSQELSFPVRLTAVLEKRGGRWLLMQLHYSLSATGQNQGESFPT